MSVTMRPSTLEPHDQRSVLRLLIGAAWLDGDMQPEERHYLQGLLEKYRLATDPEFQDLMARSLPISPAVFEQWLSAYLRQHPRREDVESLLDQISSVIYADSLIDAREAAVLCEIEQELEHRPALRLLDRLQTFFHHCLVMS
ncbi:TerB family tellurite resistance protein [Synechococcus elongatus]|nr:TerB family tellurite resistance protein [Synechococcus elongatus]